MNKFYGVGINDLQSPVSVKSKHLPFYKYWYSMLNRCYNMNSRIQPYYDGKVCESWHKLSKFKEWFDSNYIEGFQLDKDLLGSDERIYSPETCVFLPKEVNTFLNRGRGKYGKYLIGVNFDRTRNKFYAQCSNPFRKKRDSLGWFDDELDAHNAWKRKKNEHANVFADRYDGVIDKRAIERLRTMYQEITEI